MIERPIENRIECLECIYFHQDSADLNRVNIQQEALMPLLQMIEYIPSIQKAEANVKQVLKKIETNEYKAGRLERCVSRIYQQQLTMLAQSSKIQDSEPLSPKKTIDINEIKNKILDIEGKLNTTYKWYEEKIMEESIQLVKCIETNEVQLDKNSEFHNQLLSVVDKTVRHAVIQMQEDFMQQIQEIREQILFN